MFNNIIQQDSAPPHYQKYCHSSVSFSLGTNLELAALIHLFYEIINPDKISNFEIYVQIHIFFS